MNESLGRDHDAATGGSTIQATQNSLPSGSAITMWCPVNSCNVAAPAAPSRATSVMTQDQRFSGVPSPDTRRSRWSRFLAVFGSGSCSRLRRGATPVGHAATPRSELTDRVQGRAAVRRCWSGRHYAVGLGRRKAVTANGASSCDGRRSHVANRCSSIRPAAAVWVSKSARG
jgi:hypothetical protein